MSRNQWMIEALVLFGCEMRISIMIHVDTIRNFWCSIKMLTDWFKLILGLLSFCENVSYPSVRIFCIFHVRILVYPHNSVTDGLLRFDHITDKVRLKRDSKGIFMVNILSSNICLLGRMDLLVEILPLEVVEFYSLINKWIAIIWILSVVWQYMS